MSEEYELDTFVNDTILKRWSAVRRKLHEVSNFILQYHIVRRMEHSKIVPLEIAIQMFVLNFFVQHAEAPLILRRKEEDKSWCLDQCEDIFDSIREALVFLEGFEKVSRLEYIAREHDIKVKYRNVLERIENNICAIEDRIFSEYPTLCKRTREESYKLQNIWQQIKVT